MTHPLRGKEDFLRMGAKCAREGHVKSIVFVVLSVLGVGTLVLGLESARQEFSYVGPLSGTRAVAQAEEASEAPVTLAHV